MSLPKEPRQQMINMMYLVLIALLAMNVSREILKAFRMIQISIDKTHKTAVFKSENLYSKFNMYMDRDPAKTTQYFNKAMLVKKYCLELDSLLSFTKAECEKMGSEDGSSGQSAYQDQGMGLPELAQADNQDIGSEIMILRKRGDKLKELINLTRDRLFQIIESDDRENFALSLENAVDVKTNDGNVPWVNHTFENMPLAAIVTVLSKYQSDLKATEIELLSYLLNKMGEFDIPFDKLETNISEGSNYITLGEKYKANIFLSAYSSTQQPVIYLGVLDSNKVTLDAHSGNYHPVYENPLRKITDTLMVEAGKGLYELSPDKTGLQVYEGVIKITPPAGDAIYFPFAKKFVVGQPTVIASPDKMNVLYIGVDNPVSISIPGYSPNKVKASISQGQLVSNGNGKYMARVREPGKVKIFVSVLGENGGTRNMGTMEFRVKRIPPPIAMVGGKSGGQMNTAVFKVQRGIYALLENFEFEGIRYRITKFEAIYMPQRNSIRSEQGNQEEFSQKMKDLWKNAIPGDKVAFIDIMVVGPDGRSLRLPDITFRLN